MRISPVLSWPFFQTGKMRVGEGKKHVRWLLVFQSFSCVKYGIWAGCLWGSNHFLLKRISRNWICFSETFRTMFCWVIPRNTWTTKQYICNSKLLLVAYPLPVPLSPFLMSESYFDLRHIWFNVPIVNNYNFLLFLLKTDILRSVTKI